MHEAALGSMKLQVNNGRVQGLIFWVHIDLLQIFLCVQLPPSADWASPMHQSHDPYPNPTLNHTSLHNVYSNHNFVIFVILVMGQAQSQLHFIYHGWPWFFIWSFILKKKLRFVKSFKMFQPANLQLQKIGPNC